MQYVCGVRYVCMHVVNCGGDRRHRKHTNGEGERRRVREIASERKRVSVIVVCYFLLNLTGTEAFTPLFSAHNLLHKGID